VEERKVTDWLYKYYETMIEKKLKPTIMKAKMGIFCSFCKKLQHELTATSMIKSGNLRYLYLKIFLEAAKEYHSR